MGKARYALPMGLFQDIRYSLRLLAKTPIATSVAVLSLALGIGANAAIFSLINALLLRPLPVSDPQRLVSIETTGHATTDSKDLFSLPMFEELRRSQRVFSSMFLWQGGGVDNFEIDGANYPGSLETASGEYFSTLGIKPLLGRLITPADVQPYGTSAKVAVLDFHCWQEKFNGARDVVGKTIRINGVPQTIIGVTPEDFHGLQIDSGREAVVPIGYSGTHPFRDPATFGFDVYARLRPGVTIEQARAQLESVWPSVRLAALPPSFQGGQRTEFLDRRILVSPAATGNSFIRGRMTLPLEILMALSALVLLIACVNLANLMLARASARLPEMSIRAALGSGLWRMTQQLLIEPLLLSTTGALCGLLLAVWASRTLALAVWTGFVPLAVDPTPDGRVLCFTASITIATGVAFGLAPLWIIRRPEIARALGTSTRSVRGGRRWFGQVLVSSQIALSLVLLVGATLFAKSLANIYQQNPGFRRDGIMLVQLTFKPGVKTLPNRSAYYHELADRLAQIPRVRGISYSHEGPGTRYEFKEAVKTSDGAVSTHGVFEVVGPGFFSVVEMQVLAGRQFTWRDDENSKAVVMVSESLARQLFPGGNAVGRHIKIGLDAALQDLEIVGVVNSASLWVPQSQHPAAFFLPLLQKKDYDYATLNVRVDGDPLTAAPAVRNAISSLGQEYALHVGTVNQRTDRILVSERIIAALSGFFAALAMLLAAIGLYGVLSLTVAARTSEIGVRMALGAQRRDVMSMILRQVLITALIGFAIGIPLTMAGSKFIQSMIFGLPARDAATLASSILILLAAALAAGYLPARHASRIDPMEALRSN